MLTNRREKLAVIHIAKKKLNLSSNAYRALLEGAAGVESAAEIKNDTQYFNVMKAFRKAGYIPDKKMPVKDEQRGLYCTEAQRIFIKGLWELASRAKTEKSLRDMIKRIGGVDDMRWLRKRDATKVILALRDMAEKAGFNPDRKDDAS